METVTAWTRQVPQMWEELRQTGVYRVKEEYIRKKNDTIAYYYIDLYRWYTRQARRYMELPEDAEFPVWFSLSEKFRLQKIPDTVTLKVEIPKGKVMLIDMEKWDYCGNFMYVPEDSGDRARFERELERYGIRDETALAYEEKGNHYPLLRREIKESWQRVFTRKPDSPEKSFATTWEVRKEWVREVR